MKIQTDWTRLEADLIDEIDLCQGIVMDTSQLVAGETKEWSFIRSRILKSFGDRGLKGRMRDRIRKFREIESQNLFSGTEVST